MGKKSKKEDAKKGNKSKPRDEAKAKEKAKAHRKAEKLRAQQYVDPNSQASIASVRQKHLDFELSVDFSRKAFIGSVTIVFKALEDFESLILDTNELVILCVSWEHLVLPFRLHALEAPFGRALEVMVSIKAGTKFALKFEYETAPSAAGLQWLPPHLTEGKVHPYVFSQFQAIHARSFVPCQDSTGCKITYSARIRVPAAYPLTVLMSAMGTGKRVTSDGVEFYFDQHVKISPYLIAIVVGDLAGHAIGPISTVWCEPKRLQECAKEFAQVPEFIKAADAITDFPYRKIGWGKYDILVLPNSFPYGGMENPTLTFVSPSIVTGDRSMVSVVVHELAHSWFGNLITNKTWEHFSLNEGFCVWLERKIIGHLEGVQRRDMEVIAGDGDYQSSLATFASTPAALSLVQDMTCVDPDDYFSSIPYEKGSQLLLWLERAIVKDESKFERFMRAWIRGRAYGNATWDDFKTFFEDYFADDEAVFARLSDVPWLAWFEDRDPHGNPVDVLALCDRTLVEAVNSLASRWADGVTKGCNAKDMEGWGPLAREIFLDQLLVPFPKLGNAGDMYRAMDALYQFTAIRHADVRVKWICLGLKVRNAASWPAAEDMLQGIGRMKYVRPLFREMNAWDAPRAKAFFPKVEDSYHPICAKARAAALDLVAPTDAFADDMVRVKCSGLKADAENFDAFKVFLVALSSSKGSGHLRVQGAPPVQFATFMRARASRSGPGVAMSGSVLLDTTAGPVAIELYWQHAPNACRNFWELANRSYYDGTVFHRVIKDFMIQGGDPTGTGKGGESFFGKTFDDELHPDLKHTGAGILSMANAGPNTNGSQFYITLAPCPWLDGKHTIFGRVSSGMSVVKRLGNVRTDKDDRPVEKISIVTAKAYEK